MVLNTALVKRSHSSHFRHYKSIDEPIRKTLANDDFLSVEKDNAVLVINIWATWCQPCQKEIPHLNVLMETYERDGILFMAITNDEASQVDEWMDRQKEAFKYFQLYKQQALIDYLFELNPDPTQKEGQKPQLLPTNIIIKNGELLYYHSGFSEEAIHEMGLVLNGI